jgi:transcriptional regulator with XRE-family HTH domain
MNMSERIAHALASSGRPPRELAKEIGITVARISQLKAGTGGIKAENLFALARATGYSPVWLAEGHGEPRGNVPASADISVIEPVDREQNPIGFDTRWLRSMGMDPANLKHFSVNARSDASTNFIEDLLLIDTSKREPVDGGVFLLARQAGGFSLQRTILTLTSGWILKNENEAKRHYPDERVAENDIHMLNITGRAMWRGGKL